MKSYDRFSEDIEQRRAALAQRQRETLARSKEKGSQVSSDASARFAAQKEKNDAANKAAAEKKKKEAMKDEIKQDLEREREDRRKSVEKKRMEKERAQAED